MNIGLPNFVEMTVLDSQDQFEVEEFHRLRLEAFNMAKEIFTDRAGSYNVSHEPFDEMVFGIVSLASEMHKRTLRLCGLVTPSREELRTEDLDRILDTMTDVINYATWGYAMTQIAVQKSHGAVRMDMDTEVVTKEIDGQLTFDFGDGVPDDDRWKQSFADAFRRFADDIEGRL